MPLISKLSEWPTETRLIKKAAWLTPDNLMINQLLSS